jgi:hypothetical protein
MHGETVKKRHSVNLATSAGSPCLKFSRAILTLTNFGVQTFHTRCPDSDVRCFYRQLAGSALARLIGNLINFCAAKYSFIRCNLERNLNVKQGPSALIQRFQLISAVNGLKYDSDKK